MSNAIELQDVYYTWPGMSSPVLHVPKFSVTTGSRVFLLGASGSGKSTLLNLIAGLTVPQSGSVSVLGQQIHTMSARSRDRFRANSIGFIFQQFNLVPYLDIETNIKLAAHLAGTSAEACKERITPLMKNLLLSSSLLKQRADQLSVGQQQRVAIVRAMINQPKLIIADEPTSALDEESRNEFVELLLSTQKLTAATVIFVSHDRGLSRYFDRIDSMNDLNALRPAIDTKREKDSSEPIHAN